MYYKCCKIDSHSSATNFGFDKKLKIDFPVCTIYSIRIAICISRTAIYRDAVLVGDTQPYHKPLSTQGVRRMRSPCRFSANNEYPLSAGLAPVQDSSLLNPKSYNKNGDQMTHYVRPWVGIV